MAIKIPELSESRPIVEEDGSLTIQSREFFRVITDRALIIGVGSPEGVVGATIGSDYMDEAGVAGAIRYSKRDADVAGDNTMGWILN